MSGGTADRLADLTDRDADWAGLRVLVAGLGVSGFAAADALLERGASECDQCSWKLDSSTAMTS